MKMGKLLQTKLVKGVTVKQQLFFSLQVRAVFNSEKCKYKAIQLLEFYSIKNHEKNTVFYDQPSLAFRLHIKTLIFYMFLRAGGLQKKLLSGHEQCQWSWSSAVEWGQTGILLWVRRMSALVASLASFLSTWKLLFTCS